MDQGSEQNKTEAPTPFKLKRARERGVVARGVDLGFFAALSGFAIFAVVASDGALAHLGEVMRRLFTAIGGADEPEQALIAANLAYGPAFSTVALVALTVGVVVVLFEIVQGGGIHFTTTPLKPDFKRLDPGKGLKRLFSARMFKETLKSILKLMLYGAGAYLALRHAFDVYAQALDSAQRLEEAMRAGALRLIFSFIAVAIVIALLDQVLARQDFLKQMRMSRSELTREHKEREGEPRLKQKRKQLHAEFAKQTKGLGALSGSDLVIVNPHHYAVALKYDAARMGAPQLVAKGRNRIALAIKARAALLSIPVFARPALARALFAACDPGEEAPPALYREIASLYLEIMSKPRTADANHA
jgi:flagellar biosynthetic protein FlhB